MHTLPSATPLFTVFTPTHNRAHLLHRVFNSLQQQTLRDFEWVIVDDGSSDNTSTLVRSWQDAADFPIRYFTQAHGGMHAAINYGVAEALGTWFIKLDSDDACVPDALRSFRDQWLAIPEAERPSFAALTCLCHDQHGQPVGQAFPSSPLDCTSLEMRYHHRVSGEKWGANLTAVMRQFPYPTNASTSYIPESYIWDKIGRQYRTRYFNESLRIYWQDGAGQITTASAARHAPGHVRYLCEVLTHDLQWLPQAPTDFLKSAVNYGRFMLHHYGPAALLTRGAWAVVRTGLITFGLAAGCLLWLRDRGRSTACA